MFAWRKFIDGLVVWVLLDIETILVDTLLICTRIRESAIDSGIQLILNLDRFTSADEIMW